MNDRKETNLGYWCGEAVAAHPDRIALIDLSTEAPRKVTYRELDARMDRVARLLESAGIGPGARIAMAIGNRFEFVEILYGAMRAGVVPVPLNIKLGADALDYILRDAGVVAAFVEPACNRFILEVVQGLGLEHRFAFAIVPPGWSAYESELLSLEPGFDPPALSPDHPSFQPYTSGSTGKPKGVVLTHSGQIWWIRCLGKYWPDKTNDRALAAVPLYHKNAMAGAIKPLLKVGGSVVILPDFEPRRFLRALAEYRCTQAGAVPAVFTKLLQHRDLIETLDFTALKSLTLGSAPVQEALMLAVRDAFGVRVSESYGLTEGGPVMLGPPIDGGEVPFGSCGVAWPEGEVKLVDESGEASESYGELWVKNPGVTPGYYHLPEVNRKRIRDGWLATGDLFSKDAKGFFYFRGRTDDMFNCGGENIYPKEVENLLLSHQAIDDAAVVPIPHPVKGAVPVAMVVHDPRRSSGLDEANLKQFCLDRGPAYAHPRRIWMVEAMPLNGAGKVDRALVQRELQDRFGPELEREAERGPSPRRSQGEPR